jgi:hypothetical protein
MIGAKPPLRPKHVWSIQAKLQFEGRKRDLALFIRAIDILAIDSKLRGYDVVSFRVEDVAPYELRHRSRNGPAEENWSSGQGRTEGTYPLSDRRLPEGVRVAT